MAVDQEPVERIALVQWQCLLREPVVDSQWKRRKGVLVKLLLEIPGYP